MHTLQHEHNNSNITIKLSAIFTVHNGIGVLNTNLSSSQRILKTQQWPLRVRSGEGAQPGPSPPKWAITPKRATQLQLEIAAKQAELASLLGATGQEDGTVEPGMNDRN